MTAGRLLLIGEFARRARLPVSTLRYYDRIGLLSPATTDLDTGYRRYSPDQLASAVRIAGLRAVGIAPADIVRVLAGGPGAAAVLRRERHRIAGRIEQDRRRLSRIDELLDEPDDQPAEKVVLSLRRVVAQPFLAPTAELAGGVARSIAGLRSTLRARDLRRVGPWGATFPLDPVDPVSGFAFTTVDPALDDAALDGDPDLDSAWLPGSQAVRVRHGGGVDTLPLAYRAAFETVDRIGGVATGPVIEEYDWLEPNGRGACVLVPFSQVD